MQRPKYYFLVGVILLLAACAAGPKELLVEYEQCLVDNRIVKVSDTGVVEFDPETKEAVMVADQSACKEENRAWNEVEDRRERRLRDKRPLCPVGSTALCDNRGASICNAKAVEIGTCKCTCVSKWRLRSIMLGRPGW